MIEHSMTPEPPSASADGLDPSAALTLIRDQQRSVAGRIGAFVPVSLLAWAIAWLGGFGLLWLESGGIASVTVPLSVAAPMTVGLFVAAGVTSALLGIRAGRGRRGGGSEKAFAGIVYGQLWWIGCLAVFALGQALVHGGMDRAVLDVLYPALYMFFTGTMLIMAALIWSAAPMLAFGGLAVVLSALAPFAGPSMQYLLYALVGGGGLFLAALWTFIWTRRARQRSSISSRSRETRTA